ncbi:ZntA Cation transport ATPase [Candidatus Nanopelagicaceae bacterium]
MKERQINQVLLISTLLTLFIGFTYENVWALSGLIGLLPALYSLIKDIQQRTMGSDLLAVISLFATLLTHELFAASIIALMLATGRMLESWAVGQAERQLKSLISRMPRIANRIEISGSAEKITQIAIEEIRIGDRLLVRGGEITPCDGNLLGTATLDESALTGEPLPVQRVEKEAVSSGVLNAGAPFEFVATSTAENSTYEGIIKLVKAAHAKSAPGVRLANTWALRFVPIALIVAAAAWIITGEVERAVAVLVAATPCPLILAVPIAIVAGLSQSAKNGAIVKGGAILELLSRTESVLLDKTGTLTHGGPVISKIASAPNYTHDQVLQIAASLDQYSPHMVAKSIVKYANSKNIQIFTCTDVSEVAGHQISGDLNGVKTTVGQLTTGKPAWLDFAAPLIVAISQNDQLIGVIGLEDPLRSESKQMIQDLHAIGVTRIALVTGDRRESADAVAHELGIKEVFAHVTAAQKLEITESAMKSTSGTVIVVGDGINDAPALAAAHVGVAMGARGATAASEAADVIIVEDSIDRLIRAITIAKRARRKALQAAGLGMTLSLFIMATGACGITSASQGAIAQEVIDILAILWALTTLKRITF